MTDEWLASVAAMHAMLCRGAVSGGDVALVLSRLAAVFRGEVRIEFESRREDAEAGCDPLSYGCRASFNALHLQLSARASLVAVLDRPDFMEAGLEAAHLLALPLATFWRAPMAERALRASPHETHAQALVRLHRFVELSGHGDVVGWSAGAELSLARSPGALPRSRVEAALLAAAQAFLRGERNLQRVSPALSVSFGVLAPAALRGAMVIGALHPSAEIDDSLEEPCAAELLSATELAVARQLLSGLAESAIAEQLRLATTTVKTHRKTIYRKLGVASRLELASLFRR